MTERLTREQMAVKYPNQYLGIRNPIYTNNDGVSLESAEVVYTDKTGDELFDMQIENTGIICWYTNDNAMALGMVGVY